MQFTVDIQAKHLARALKAVRDELATPARMMGAIGIVLRQANTARHRQGLAPDGSKWQPLSPLTIGATVQKAQADGWRKKRAMSLATARKVRAKKGSQMLRDSGDMLGSFNNQIQGGTLRLGFGDPKAKWHHFGTGTYGPKGKAYTISPKTQKALAFAGMVRKRVTHPGIPARPLIGFPATDRQLTSEVVNDYLTAVLRRV